MTPNLIYSSIKTELKESENNGIEMNKVMETMKEKKGRRRQKIDKGFISFQYKGKKKQFLS